MIYLDYASTSKIHPKALKKIIKTWKKWGNPSSLHTIGKINKEILENLRTNIKKILKVDNKSQIYFTSNATEANNIAINSSQYPIITSKLEHASISNIPNIETFENLKDLEVKLKKQKYTVSLSLINNETGIKIATKEIITLIKKYNSKLHIDASQAKQINYKKLKCDYLTISSHKLGGPIGIAAIIATPLLKPLIFGGSQEFNIKPGTEAIPLIAGLEIALKESKKIKYDHLYNHIKKNIDKKYFFETYVKGEYEKHIICLLTYNIPGTEVFAYMDINNIAISYGSACSSGTLDKLKALTIYKEIPSKNGIRISFGFDTKIEELDKFCTLFNNLMKNNNHIK